FSTLSLHDALPICQRPKPQMWRPPDRCAEERTVPTSVFVSTPAQHGPIHSGLGHLVGGRLRCPRWCGQPFLTVTLTSSDYSPPGAENAAHAQNGCPCAFAGSAAAALLRGVPPRP